MLGICHCNYRLIIFFFHTLSCVLYTSEDWGKIPSPSIIPICVHFQLSCFITGEQSAGCPLLPPPLIAPPSLPCSFTPSAASPPPSLTLTLMTGTHTHTHTGWHAALPWHLSRGRVALGNAASVSLCIMWLCIYYMLINSCCVNLSIYFHCCLEYCIVHYCFTVFRKISYLVSPRPLYDQKYGTKSNI